MSYQGRDSHISLSNAFLCGKLSVVFSVPVRFKSVQAGVTLIEVLVTLVLVSIGLAGSLSLQARAMQDSQSSYYRSQAINMATDITDRIRLNPDAARAGRYTLNTDSALKDFDPVDTDPSSQKLAKNDLRGWLAWTQTALPSGRAQIRRNGDQFRICVYWDENKDATDGKNIVDPNNAVCNVADAMGAEAFIGLEMDL